MSFGPATNITGYKVTVQTSGPPVVDVYAETAAEPVNRFAWHLDPSDMATVLNQAATVIRAAVSPPDLVSLMQFAMKQALSDMLVAKGIWSGS